MQVDLHYLEVYKGGTFKDLAKAHRNLVSGSQTPSSLGNKYRDILYVFSATILLIGLGYISNTLISYIKHNHATIKAKKELFLNRSIKDRNKYIRN